MRRRNWLHGMIVSLFSRHALEVSTPGWWANIVTVVVPCAILIILYLQSEKRKYEEKMGIKKQPPWPKPNDTSEAPCSGPGSP